MSFRSCKKTAQAAVLSSSTGRAIDLHTLRLTLDGFLQFPKIKNSPSKMVFDNVKFDEGIPGQYLCDVW